MRPWPSFLPIATTTPNNQGKHKMTIRPLGDRVFVEPVEEEIEQMSYSSYQ